MISNPLARVLVFGESMNVRIIRTMIIMRIISCLEKA